MSYCCCLLYVSFFPLFANLRPLGLWLSFFGLLFLFNSTLETVVLRPSEISPDGVVILLFFFFFKVSASHWLLQYDNNCLCLHREFFLLFIQSFPSNSPSESSYFGTPI